MRRLVLRFAAISLLAGMLAGACTAFAAAARTPPSARTAILCPYATPAVPGCCEAIATCCPLVVTGACCSGIEPAFSCCPGSPPGCVSPLSISASPNPSTAGAQVVVSGQLPGTAGKGVQVRLWQERPGKHAFTRLAQTQTDGSGGFRFALPRGLIQTNRQFYVTAGGRQSATLEQRVHARVTLTAKGVGGPKGNWAFSGRVAPGHAGERVLVQLRSAGRWVTIGRPRLGRRSRFASEHRFGATGSWRLRAVFPGDSRNIASSSPVLTIAAVT